ncbi:DUF2953 domain-containing protein [Bacillus sp. REN16]|uniref:DUF2953 domain-containing protein n=1 Tax=Bacillus sp. REN16 TaxID=2887296 RepID=UPI001E2E4D55|nr:DUF2953 domain-containing protein [Bacillus sp. REN16]MCC3356423.1 DUF2953 domain-containing protein [Bacillus sp. REN16]
MKWVLFIFLILLFFIILILITRLTIFIEANHSQDDDHIKIRFSIWFGLIRYTINVPMVAIDNETPSIVFKKEKKADLAAGEKKKKEKFSVQNLIVNLQEAEIILHRVINLVPILKSFLKKISVSKFKWHSHIGVGDAAHTGIITGLAWSIKGTIIGVISQYLNLKTHPDYSITPSFQIAVSETRLRCMIHFRIGHAMVAGIRAIINWRGSVPKFKSPTLSKLNETDSDKKSV